MTTRPIKKYIKEKSDAMNAAIKSSNKVLVKGKGPGRQFKAKDLRKAMEKTDDVNRLMKQKPKGMSNQEWMRQIKSGEAMVQNAKRAKRTRRGLFNEGLEKVKPSGPKKPKEFIITTMREPKKIKNPKASARARAKKVLRQMQKGKK
tara:strand:+ start:1112 stop:1552 length:441 start_codon:yes stop_codon:yes gene_type:complete